MLRHDGALDDQIRFAFKMVATRTPTEVEAKLLRMLFERQCDFFRDDPEAAAKFVKVEGRPIPTDLNTVDLAAAAAMASAIMNPDAAVTIR